MSSLHVFLTSHVIVENLLDLRFLDDVFIIWTHGRKSFDAFLDILNNHEPPIKFKSIINENSVDYLDMPFTGETYM